MGVERWNASRNDDGPAMENGNRARMARAAAWMDGQGNLLDGFRVG
ncbi:hypothetical protein O166_12660 [Pseudogulbenkiania ferrooxidans EGD-HP2]|uniref:Uncharacterized protein n=1 Tax=Pseudogulbenkiania ferrooxidans EGD-HP2 TaxID=1388764 RepID=A0ABN0N463_9NEIS|nr:hypothetical protein O166_12660 [Pseudogulbenkiania ferrooxidans EGD-HP2]